MSLNDHFQWPIFKVRLAFHVEACLPLLQGNPAMVAGLQAELSAPGPGAPGNFWALWRQLVVSVVSRR